MQDDRHNILNIDGLQLNLAATDQRHDWRGMNEIRETFDEGSILAKQDGWLNNRPIESALLQHLLGEIAPLHIAARFIRPGAYPADLDDTPHSGLFRGLN